MILITGATGLIGGHLLIKLYNEKKKIRALIRKSSSFDQLMLICGYYGVNWMDVRNCVDWIYGDMQDEDSLIKACCGVSEIYHCAAVVSMDGMTEDSLSRINVRGTELICKVALAQNVEAFCMISSIAAIGQASNPDRLADETCHKNEKESGSDYSLSKFRSEEIVWKYIGMGLPAVIVNPGVVLGAGLLNKGSMKIFETGMKGIPFYTKGGTGYVDVRDVVNFACLLLVKRVKGERFILVSENATYKSLFCMIADKTGIQKPFIPIGNPVLRLLGIVSSGIQLITRKQLKYTRTVLLAAGNRKYYSSEKIKKETGVEFIPLSDTVDDIINFIRYSQS